MRTSPTKPPLSRKDFNSHASPAKLNSSLLHSSHNKTLNSNTETSYAKTRVASRTASCRSSWKM